MRQSSSIGTLVLKYKQKSHNVDIMKTNVPIYVFTTSFLFIFYKNQFLLGTTSNTSRSLISITDPALQSVVLHKQVKNIKSIYTMLCHEKFPWALRREPSGKKWSTQDDNVLKFLLVSEFNNLFWLATAFAKSLIKCNVEIVKRNKLHPADGYSFVLELEFTI